MNRVYEDSNLVLRKHRVSCFDLGYDLHPTLALITPGSTQSFEKRDLIQRTQAIAEGVSQGSITLIANDTDLIPAVLAALSLCEDSQKISAWSSANIPSNLSGFGLALLESLTEGGRFKSHDTSQQRSSCNEQWRIYWFAKDDRAKIQIAIDFFADHPDVKGAVFIIGYARSAVGGLQSRMGPRPYMAIENATGLGEIYFL
jgi:hypothetical protein